jgi:PAS domain S-box-containing protein
MRYDDLMRQIEDARRRLAAMEERADDSAEQTGLRVEAVEEFSSVLEELHVASEELRQQQEELVAARQVAEAERQRYQELFDFAPDGYLVTSPEGTIQEANRAATTMFGVAQEFLAGKPLAVFVAKEDRKAFHGRVARLAVEGGSAQGLEVFVQPRHGTPFPAAMTVSTVCDAAGHCTGLRWSLRDVTERKREEERIVWLASFPELDPNPAIEADAAGCVHYANAAAMRIAPDLRALGLRHPWLADLPSVVAELRGGGRDSLAREVKLGNAWYEQRLCHIPEVSRVRIYCFDLTERKRAEEALRESQEELRRAQALTHLGSWRWDLQHKEFIWCDELHRVFGMSQGAPVTYDAFLDTVHPDDRAHVDQQWSAALRGKPYDIEHRIVVGDTVKWVRERAEPELDKDGALLGVFGTVQDITDRKQGEATLQSAYDALAGQLAERTMTLTGASRPLQAEIAPQVEAEDEMGRLGRALERRACELGALDRVARALTASLRPESVLGLLLTEVRALLGTEGAGVLRHDPESNDLVFVAVEGAGLERLMDARLPATAGIVGRAFSEKRSVLVHDVRSDPRLYSGIPALSTITLRSMVAVPLISRGTAIGVLGTINKTDGAFTDDDVQILTALANGAAVAIENAQLYAAEQTRRRQLEAVRAVTAELTRELDLRRVLQLIASQAGELLGCRSGGVWLWDEEEQVLGPVVWLTGKYWLRGQRLRLGEGLVGSVAEQRRGMIVNEYDRWPKAVPATVEHGTITAVIGEPLFYRERLLGVLVIDNEGTGRAFTPEDSNTLALFASPAAIAIQNARFFQEAQHGKARLERLSHRLVEVQEAERRHIARELHDEVGQMLTGLKFMLDVNPGVATAPTGEASMNAQAVVSDLLTRVREMSLDLRPAMLDDLGLLPVLMWYCGRYQDRTRVHVTLKHTGLDGCRFPTGVETAAYRIVQEALTNVARHAKTEETTVRTWAGEDTLGVQIEDGGVGFDLEAVLASHATSGLAGMDERASLLGGRFTVESTPGQGTCVTAEFPLQHGPHER